MSKPFVVATITSLAVLAFSSILCAQSTASTQTAEVKGQKWNNDVPTGNRANPSFYAGKKSGPAPRRDLSGIWDATAEGGIQAGGAIEHPAVYPGDSPGSEAELQRFRGRQPDEKGVVNPLPYTPLGEAALEANKPTGQSI